MKKIDIMLPVYHGNFQMIEPSIKRLNDFFSRTLGDYDWCLVLAINGRNAEKVIGLATKLSKEFKRIKYDYVEQAGKGSGVLHSWMNSNADIVAYMDVDLSTEVKDFPNLIRQIELGHNISIGSRYHPQSVVKRGWKRKFISLVYHKLFMKIILGSKDYTDGQCGFKAIDQKTIKNIVPLIKNKNWFFESEMLFLAQKLGFKIKEIPICWTESKFSGLTLYKAIIEFIISGLRLRG